MLSFSFPRYLQHSALLYSVFSLSAFLMAGTIGENRAWAQDATDSTPQSLPNSTPTIKLGGTGNTARHHAERSLKTQFAPAIRVTSEDDVPPTPGYEPIQRGVFDQNGAYLQERVDYALGDLPERKSSVPPLPRPEAIFTDPFGWNSALRRRGIAFMVDNTNEFSGAITPPTKGYGLRQGSSNAGQFSYESDIDWETLAGITGFSTHAIAVSRYGIPASRMFGDNLNPSSEIYGGGGNVAFHMVFFYGEETLLKGRINIAAGRMSYLSDFSSNPLYCNFMNNAFCGNPKPSSDNYAHASYPDANWALRIRVRPATHFYFQTGVYFPQKGIYGNTQYRTGFKFNGADISGQSIPIEGGWEPEFGKDKLLGHYKLGVGIDTAEHDSNYYDINHNPRAITGLSPYVYHSAWSAWALADQMLLRHKTSDTLEGGLTLLAGAYFNGQRSSTRAQFYEIGLVDTGFWAARPLDAIGANFSYTRVSGSVTRAQRLQESLGQPLMNGSYGPQRFGETFEAFYRIHVMRGITFAPDFQYYFRPGAQKVLRDAAVLGFKTHVQLF